MTKPTDQEIEHVARAMCEAEGVDPDGRADDMPDPNGNSRLSWDIYSREATRFLAAYRAMQEWH